MASSSLLSLALCLLVLLHTSLAQREHGEPRHRHIEQNNEQLEYAGVATIRYRIQPQDRTFAIFVEGNGYIEDVIPGCLAETFQSSQQSEGEGGQRYRDQHYRTERIEHGGIDEDVIVEGVTDLRGSTMDQEIIVAGVGRYGESGY